MVARKFNRVVAKVSGHPVYWFRQIGADWFCRDCHIKQPKDSVSFELVTRYATKNIKETHPDKDQAMKHFLCLNCAEKMTESTLDKIRLCKKGPEAYDAITEI